MYCFSHPRRACCQVLSSIKELAITTVLVISRKRTHTHRATYIKQTRPQFAVSAQKPADYESLLKRLQDKLGTDARKATSRLEIPQPQIIWVGKNTIFRNFMDFPKALRRDPEKILLYLNKELASAGYIQRERVIFLGRKTPSSFNALIDRYVKDYVQCPVCGSPDTRTEKNKKLGFLICEACGAKSSIKGNYA